MLVSEREVHYHIITIAFPAIFFGLIVLYASFEVAGSDVKLNTDNTD